MTLEEMFRYVFPPQTTHRCRQRLRARLRTDALQLAGQGVGLCASTSPSRPDGVGPAPRHACVVLKPDICRLFIVRVHVPYCSRRGGSIPDILRRTIAPRVSGAWLNTNLELQKMQRGPVYDAIGDRVTISGGKGGSSLQVPITGVLVAEPLEKSLPRPVGLQAKTGPLPHFMVARDPATSRDGKARRDEKRPGAAAGSSVGGGATGGSAAAPVVSLTDDAMDVDGEGDDAAAAGGNKASGPSGSAGAVSASASRSGSASIPPVSLTLQDFLLVAERWPFLRTSNARTRAQILLNRSRYHHS